MKSLIGIFGGTFDPIHNGHLLVVDRLLEKLNFSEIKLVPCKLPVHKNPAHATATQRVEMLQLVVAEHPKLIIDERELKRSTASYMLETLQSLQTEYPNESLVLIIGTDSFNSLHKWYQWQRLTDYAHIIVVKRPDSELHWPKELKSFFSSKLVENSAELYNSHQGKLLLFETETMAVSSSQLRKDLADKKDVHSYLPASVLKYIKKSALYG